MNTLGNRAVFDRPAEVYHADKNTVSKHGLDLINRSPALYKHHLEAPPEPRTPAMRWGTLVHLWVLEPEHVEERTFTAPVVNRRTKAGKEEWDAAVTVAGSRELVTVEERVELDAVTAAVHAHPLASQLLEPVYPTNCEVSLYWHDTDTGAPCRARPDVIVDDFLIDLKTTANASTRAFNSDAWKFRYHVQAAYYLDACRAVGKPAEDFVFIAVEKEAPYLVQVFYAEPEWIEAGRTAYKQDLETYMRCLESGEWPGLSTEGQPLTIPEWAR